MGNGFSSLDRDTDRYCNALLKEISALDRPLSKSLSRRLDDGFDYAVRPLPRKLVKVAIVHEEFYPLYERAASSLRALPEWRTYPHDPTVSTIYQYIYGLVSQFRLPGSVEARHGK